MIQLSIETRKAVDVISVANAMKVLLICVYKSVDTCIVATTIVNFNVFTLISLST